MDQIRTTKQLAEEAMRVLRESPMTSAEHLEFLVRQGIIDRSGRVLVCSLFRDHDAEQTVAPTASPPSANGSAAQPAEPHAAPGKQDP